MSGFPFSDDANESRQGARLFGLRLPSRIPPLSGWFLQLFRIVWWVIFALALFGLFFLSYSEEKSFQAASKAVYSAGLTRTAALDDTLIVMPLNDMAREAGIGDRDTILSVDGEPLAASSEGWTRQLSGPDGSVASLEVRHLDGTVETVRLTRSSAYIEKAYAGSGLTYEKNRLVRFANTTVRLLILLFLSMMLVLRCPREPVAALIAFGLVFGSITGIRSGLSENFAVLQLAVIFLCVPLGTTLFPDGRFVTRWNWAVVAMIPVLIASYLAYSYLPSLSLPYMPSLLVMFALLGISVAARYRKLDPGSERQQMKFFALGVAVLTICMVLAAMVGFFGVFGQPDSGRYGWAAISFEILISIGFSTFAFGILVSLLRYRLYDADRTISRSFAIGALSLSILAIFAASEEIIELLGEEWFGQDIGALSGGLGAAFAAILIAPLHKRLDRWSESWFQSDLTQLRDHLPELVADWRETMTPGEIGNAVLERIAPAVRAGCGAITLDSDIVATRETDEAATRRFLSEHRSEPKKPLEQEIAAEPFSTRLSLEAAGHGRIGWLLLGPRPDGSALGKDEREALLAIADPLARALQVSDRRTARQEEDRDLIEALLRRVSELEHRIAAPRAQSSSGLLALFRRLRSA